MKKRLLTAAVGIPLVVVLLLVRGWAVELAVTLLTLIAQVECYNALRAAGHRGNGEGKVPGSGSRDPDQLCP